MPYGSISKQQCTSSCAGLHGGEAEGSGGLKSRLTFSRALRAKFFSSRCPDTATGKGCRKWLVPSPGCGRKAALVGDVSEQGVSSKYQPSAITRGIAPGALPWIGVPLCQELSERVQEMHPRGAQHWALTLQAQLLCTGPRWMDAPVPQGPGPGVLLMCPAGLRARWVSGCPLTQALSAGALGGGTAAGGRAHCFQG